MSTDPEQPPRLSQSNDADIREVIGSARLDVPSPGTREASIQHVLRARRSSPPVAWIAIASAAVLAAGVALWLRPHPTPDTPVVREAPASPSASASHRAPLPLAPELEACTPAVRAEGTAPLIDDFEDANTRIAPLERRAGFWVASNDGTGTQQPPLGVPFAMSRIPGGRGESHFALHTSGSKFSKWGAVVSAELSPRRCYDASAYGGLTFWARGRGSVMIVAKMTQVSPEEYGGSCTHDCFDGHRISVPLGSKWQEHRVPWSALKQAGFGQQLPFDPRSLISIELTATPDQTPFDFWIDDLRFLER